jgi:hypothetical protein
MADPFGDRFYMADLRALSRPVSFLACCELRVPLGYAGSLIIFNLLFEPRIDPATRLDRRRKLFLLDETVKMLSRKTNSTGMKVGATQEFNRHRLSSRQVSQ